MRVDREFGRGLWGALSASYYEGGRTTLNGTPARRAARRMAHGVDLVAAGRLAELDQACPQSSGLYARTGSDFDGAGVVWQHIYGETRMTAKTARTHRNAARGRRVRRSAKSRRAGSNEFYLGPTFTDGKSYAFEGGSNAKTDTGYGLTFG